MGGRSARAKVQMEGQGLDVQTPIRPSSLGIDCERKKGAQAGLEGAHWKGFVIWIKTLS